MKAKPEETNIKTKTFTNYEKTLGTLLQKSGKDMIKSTLLLVVQMHYWLQA